jgi:hypothetical protein
MNNLTVVFNVRGIHFDPARGKPIGQPFQVSKFDSLRLMIPSWIAPVGLSLTQDKLVLTMEQVSGNIWVLDNVDREFPRRAAHTITQSSNLPFSVGWSPGQCANRSAILI